MQYLLLNYMNENAMMNLPKEEAGKMHAAYMAYTEAMKKAEAAFRRAANEIAQWHDA